MSKTLTAFFATGVLSFTGMATSAQNKAADVPPTEEEKLFLAAPSTYISGEAYATEWPVIRDADVLWRKRVHRTLDAVQDENRAALMDPQGKDFSALLLEAVRTHAIKAYADERFSRPLADDEVEAVLATGRLSAFRLKEDWMYLRDGRGLVDRIIGIAPLSDGLTTAGEMNAQPLFWIYYPELRPTLRGEIADGEEVKNLDEWFEGRHFMSREVKTIYEQAPPRMQ